MKSIEQVPWQAGQIVHTAKALNLHQLNKTENLPLAPTLPTCSLLRMPTSNLADLPLNLTHHPASDPKHPLAPSKIWQHDYFLLFEEFN